RPPALLLAALVLLAPASAAGAETVHRERLGNGFTLLVRENPLAPVVAVSLLVRMGVRWESPAEAGISNFLHAVMVKGTTRRSGAELAEAIAALGGKVSAAGDVDSSGIQATALGRFWRDLLGLVAELALEPRLAPEDVDAERDWLLSRVQRRRDSPSGRAFDEFYAALYAPHPYAQPVIGTPESLRRIDRAALVAHYRAFYRPERMVLAVSGHVRAPEVAAEVRRLFGGLPGGGEAAPPSNPRPAGGGRRVVVEQPAQQAQIVAGALAPSMAEPDHAAVKVLATVLGGGMAGRLFAELRDRQALAYTASAFYEPVRGPGALVLYLGTAPDNAEAAEAALRREVERIRREPVGAAELDRAKGYLLGHDAMDRRTNARQAWYLAFYELQGVGTDFAERYRRAVQAVSADDVHRAARAYLDPLTVTVLRPPARR
ncbi:MAG TPA: pitrilysin family protein, partial [Candidatus Binatia bacterium]|nr:pitrilysin family protein [Candidatus Binatia bacterium]